MSRGLLLLQSAGKRRARGCRREKETFSSINAGGNMLPLEGIRVLDLTRLLAGPFCTAILGDLGADIIKVEALPDGDLYRKSPPFHGGESVSFLAANRNKRSIAVDFRKPAGLDLVRQIAEGADVL